MVAELLAIQVPGGQQGAQAHISRVAAVFHIVADGPPRLVRFDVAAKHRPGGNADDAVEGDPIFHKNIGNAGGEHPAHGAAFQYKSGLHAVLSVFAPRRAQRVNTGAGPV